jgi:hypothetical protein
MSFKAEIYQLIIASPGDVARERQMAREIILEWNSINSKSKGTYLMPIGWEYDSIPEMGDRPQEFINKQLLEESDLLIGIFWTRIGSQTGSYISGSVEEIEKHVESGKPAMLYFSNSPVMPDSINYEQYSTLQNFKKECQVKGLVENYDSPEEFSRKLTRQLAAKINHHPHFAIKEIYSEEQNIFEKEKTDNYSEQEKLLIVEMSKDPSGIAFKIATQSGFSVQTNGKNIATDYTSRVRAEWDELFDNLLYKSIIQERGYKNEVFALTAKGYKIADSLKAEQ